MLHYVLRRLAHAVPVLFGVSVVVFLLLHVTGDPAALLLPVEAGAEDIERLRTALGLDDPLLVQYGRFLGNALRGDFGDSLRQGDPALVMILERLPATLELSFMALLIALAVAIPSGILAALHRQSWIDLFTSVVAFAGVSMPNFWVGLLLILYFGVQLRWFPISGRGGVEHLILPALTLGWGMAATVARLTRSSVLEVIREDYVRTARAKGVGERIVIARHVLRNCLIPITTVVGLQFGKLLSGAVITETIFAWPGMGRLMIQAIEQRDFPVVQAGVLLLAVLFIGINLAVDVLYAVLNPRIRYG